VESSPVPMMSSTMQCTDPC